MRDFIPAATPFIFGAEALIAPFLKGRFSQSILLSGPRGVGKATFSYHVARYLLQREEARSSFFVSADTPLFAQVATGVTGDLKVIQRRLNTSGKMGRDISVDSVREGVQFLQSTSLDGGWRVVIIDSADELGIKSANALLKTLEEPPKKALVILIAHSVGRVLPTLRSRCAHHKMIPLNEEDMAQSLTHLLPETSSGERTFLTRHAQGCPGQALALFQLGGVAFYDRFIAVLKGLTSNHLHPAIAFTEQLLTAEDPERLYEAFGHFFSAWLVDVLLAPSSYAKTEDEKSVIVSLRQKHPSSFWTGFWSYATQNLLQSQGYSLDRRHVLLSLFYTMMVGDICAENEMAS